MIFKKYYFTSFESLILSVILIMSGRHRAGSFYIIILTVTVIKIINVKVWIIAVFEGGLRTKSCK